MKSPFFSRSESIAAAHRRRAQWLAGLQQRVPLLQPIFGQHRQRPVAARAEAMRLAVLATVHVLVLAAHHRVAHCLGLAPQLGRRGNWVRD